MTNSEIELMMMLVKAIKSLTENLDIVIERLVKLEIEQRDKNTKN